MTTVELSVPWRGERLAGSLVLPREPATRPPAVLMLQGSGPSDRDADGYFEPIRRAFLERGLAVCSFDKPGCGASSGDWRHHALHARSDQASTVLGALRDRDDVDGSRVGVWGHSQGGWLVQILAAAGDPVFAISNSGPSIDVESQDLYGCEHTMRAAGRSEADIERAVGHVHRLHDAARRGLDFATVDDRILAPARGAPWSEYVSVTDADDWALTVAFVQEAYDPLPCLRAVRCPYLAVFGGRDTLVPAWSGACETGEALSACDDATVVVFPHGDHRIQLDGPLDFAHGYLDLLGEWAARRVTRAG